MAYTFDISDNRRIVEALKTGDEETFKGVSGFSWLVSFLLSV